MRRIFMIFFLFLSFVSSAKNLIYLDERGQTRVFADAVVTERSMDFVKLEIIGELIRGVVVSQSLRQEETIMILPSGIIVSLSHENQRATVEFGSEFENSLIIKDDKVHINAELLGAITDKSFFSESEALILYAQPLTIKSIENRLDSISITLDRDILPDFFTIWWTGSGSLAVTLRPAKIDPFLVYDGMTVTTGRGFVKISAEKPWPDVEYEIKGRTLILRGKSGIGRTLQQETSLDFDLNIFESYAGGQKFMMSFLEMNSAKFSFEIELANDRVSGLEKATDTLRRSGAQIMINGGYFDQNQNLPIGLLVRDGKVLGLPTLGRPAIYFTEDGRVHVSRMDIIYLARFDDCFVQITGVNSPYRGEAVLYTDEYRNGIPEFDDFVYLSIKDSRIISKGYVSGVEKGSDVLVLSPSSLQKISDSASVGRSVSLELLNSYGERITGAVEGGPMIIHDGRPVTDYERNYYSASLLDVRAPRTLVGVKVTGEVVFIVIDGYQQSSYGLTFKEMIEFFKDKGFFSLMCLDGGKSSVMSVNGEIINSPSSGVPSLPVIITGSRK
ncbi:MAG TPA: phosphodiester glycosidase family protein [Mesotoga infera]|uniref:Phosphodiester glycosidase family protein n=1 Tax=Mesotoga infera TaxID=1236046 RepID=A0A7C1CVR2_9BACT|nr:phosphodiester glycosidase family protein [Mesotoga infera]